MKNASELEFEMELINHLTNIGGVKQWDYVREIKTTESLWNNFKNILEQNNRGRINETLSITEFNQVKKEISGLNSPFSAGQFLYGVNGVSEIEIVMDNGKRVFLTVFDQSQVGAGNTVYQVVNQISRDRVIDGKSPRIFDVTLLINGLPIIQIELKKAKRPVSESLNQMKQYIDERQYTDIFSTLQVLIAMNPYEIKYMANCTINNFNTDFAFDWQDENNATPIRDWKKFTDLVLSIPMAHDLATRYMVLDGTKNKEGLKVMRPYQVYATKKVLDKVSAYRFKYEDNKLGYIWHTTGSGKTITSFKTAWLASRLPNVDKVVFLVDRISLTNQTKDAYQAYDPIVTGGSNSGVIAETASVNDLSKKLRAKTDKNIIVTSIQKMAILIGRESFKNINENIIFIVDEAHRSTGDGVNSEGMLERIRSAIPSAGWVGYTGTPRFPLTKDIFGPLIHAYTIKEAIADRNVIGFKVEFKETIEAPKNPTEEDIDDNIKASVYDTSSEHIELVVKDIIDNWDSRSKNRMYNALFTVHVGGQATSSPRVMQYYNEFKRINATLPESKRIVVGASFSRVTNNSDNQLPTNQNLYSIIQDYNEMFNTSYGMDTLAAYTEDLTSRLNKTAPDGKYFDLVIVIDQLLTGFDAPELNALYIDRTLKGSSLIQAYSRTNRVHNMVTKPTGIVINYRWPVQNEESMNQAFRIYSDRNSANEQISISETPEESKSGNIQSGIIAPEYAEVCSDIKQLVKDIKEVTYDFTDIPHSEEKRVKLLETLEEYNALMNRIKQYPYDDRIGSGFPIHNIEEFYSSVGFTEDQEAILISVLAPKLKKVLAANDEVDISFINLAMEHIQEVIINYDYLIDLISKMADEVHFELAEEASTTMADVIREISKLETEKERNRFRQFVENIFSGEFKFKSYPSPKTFNEITNSMELDEKRSKYKLIKKFMNDYGLENSTTADELYALASKHTKGADDLNKRNEVSDILYKAREHYKVLAIEEVAELSPIGYRNKLRSAITDLADKIKEND